MREYCLNLTRRVHGGGLIRSAGRALSSGAVGSSRGCGTLSSAADAVYANAANGSESGDDGGTWSSKNGVPAAYCRKAPHKQS